MNTINQNNSLRNFFLFGPIILLFLSVLNEFDVNYLDLKYFSFNFSFILIFFFTLKKIKYFGYLSIFIAGLINDTVNGFPIGVSSLLYVLLSTVSGYLRSITLSPNIIKDWIFFIVTISVLNSINYMILNIFFLIELDLIYLIVNNSFTALLYLLFSYFFNIYYRIFLKGTHV